MSLYEDLQNQAYLLRHGKGVKTRIDYSPDGLSLFYKGDLETPWIKVDQQPIDNQDRHMPQVDGSLDPVNATSLASHENINQRVSDFASNHQKQTKALEEDTTKVDYDVTLNNNEENCNIKCNPGFYAQVARPSFCSLNKDSIITSSNISMVIK